MNYKYLLIFTVLSFYSIIAQPYQDQFYIMRTDSIFSNIESNDGLRLSDDGKSIVLLDNRTTGSLIIKPQYSTSPFNEGLPSWNGAVTSTNASFKIQMSFPYSGGWSPWLTVGYWKNQMPGNYGATSYAGGEVDIDYVLLKAYQSGWKFKIIMYRNSVSEKSPAINKLSFFVSDSRTTSNVNITNIVNDNPSAISIPTDFIYQYGVDPVIGGDICSPSSVAMIIRSYNIPVNILTFASDNYDTYFGRYGLWPRVVQNAAEYGLDGAVTRYRTWSEAYSVLAKGGRISISVGLPLYSGHLMMLAGFTSDGRPIVHDPARSNGKNYIYNKTSLSQSWFNKGGISYTFYLPDSLATSVEESSNITIADEFKLYQNYPNPFNPATTISYSIPVKTNRDAYLQMVTLKVYDVLGNEVATLINEEQAAGNYIVEFSASGGASRLSSGVYFYQLQAGDFNISRKMVLLK